MAHGCSPLPRQHHRRDDWPIRAAGHYVHVMHAVPSGEHFGLFKSRPARFPWIYSLLKQGCTVGAWIIRRRVFFVRHGPRHNIMKEFCAWHHALVAKALSSMLSSTSPRTARGYQGTSRPGGKEYRCYKSGRSNAVQPVIYNVAPHDCGAIR